MTTFELQSKEGQSEKLLSFFKKILPETRNFQCNKGAEISRLSENQFIIITYWEHENNLGEYLDWREKRGDFSTLLSFLIQAPSITTYQVLEDV
jgi:heme-degrading monooxygenase HmoA